ncbi:MAG: DUF1292 domain-containing protein [Acholeplasmatales bacterium]|nr:DUF1292 domain-containing protein [Acholeplasmatales bacterium]
MTDRTIKIKEDGKEEVTCDILFTYHSNEFNKDYVVFQIRGKDLVSAASYNPNEGAEGELKKIDNDEEWAMIEDLLEDYQNQEEDEEDGK